VDMCVCGGVFVGERACGCVRACECVCVSACVYAGARERIFAYTCLCINYAHIPTIRTSHTFFVTSYV
jgi:hypothetical protein